MKIKGTLNYGNVNILLGKRKSKNENTCHSLIVLYCYNRIGSSCFLNLIFFQLRPSQGNMSKAVDAFGKCLPVNSDNGSMAKLTISINLTLVSYFSKIFEAVHHQRNAAAKRIYGLHR